MSTLIGSIRVIYRLVDVIFVTLAATLVVRPPTFFGTIPNLRLRGSLSIVYLRATLDVH